MSGLNRISVMIAAAAMAGAKFAEGLGSKEGYKNFGMDGKPLGQLGGKGNRAFQRKALKRRNQQKHRLACRG